jgi:ferritin-like metal-binding protein YciE
MKSHLYIYNTYILEALNNSMRQNQKSTINEKLVLYLNNALSMENAAVERLKKRTKEASLQDARKQLKLHFEETKGQQKRLQQLITNLGGKPTKDKAGLPIPSSPKSLMKNMKNSLTSAEWELKKTEEDTIIENAEIICYNTLIQNSQIMNKGDTIPVLKENLQEEENMFGWLKQNTPSMLTQLWPKIESAVKS